MRVLIYNTMYTCTYIYWDMYEIICIIYIYTHAYKYILCIKMPINVKLDIQKYGLELTKTVGQ